MKPVPITDHAHERWAERADRSGVGGPRTAWHEGKPITVPHGLTADEVRYHAASETVLVQIDGSIVTVIDADGTCKPRLRGALAAVRGGDQQ
ncbi:hypothetical protein [Halomicrobium katesii]|uniref:hypothetical protein n=1 Tax=Halomicrobium katesii TaxID=437163 RepID=UPI0003744D11|nr:hypothetical protein [Halomicrobium katesii]